MERYPSGIGSTGFMQKNVAKGFPPTLKRIEVPKKGGTVNYPLVYTTDDLLWLANQNTVTIHVWPSRVPKLMFPDLVVFDLDPSIDDGAMLRRATLAVRDLLLEVGLESWVKTSGSKGYHIVVPLDGKTDFEAAGAFAFHAASVLVQRDPETFTLEFMKVDRGHRIYADIGRNGPGATYAAPYTVRPKPGAPVSAPCTWDEIEAGKALPQSFNIRNMPDRLEAVGDLWAGIHAHGKSLKRPLQKLKKEADPEKLDAYKSANERRFGPRR
jgi:bifunctional non-homologous end joining protein LigD